MSFSKGLFCACMWLACTGSVESAMPRPGAPGSGALGPETVACCLSALTDLRDAARSLRLGGVGFYPGSNFVHLDTGRIRGW